MRTRSGLWTRFRGEWLALAGFALLVVFGLGLTREIARRRALSSELASLQGEVSRLTDRRDELQRLITEFQRPSTQEAEARLKLNLARPGERALIVERQPLAAEPSPSGSSPDSHSLPGRWWQYFFGS